MLVLPSSLQQSIVIAPQPFHLYYCGYCDDAELGPCSKLSRVSLSSQRPILRNFRLAVTQTFENSLFETLILIHIYLSLQSSFKPTKHAGPCSTQKGQLRSRHATTGPQDIPELCGTSKHLGGMATDRGSGTLLRPFRHLAPAPQNSFHVWFGS